MIHVVLATRNAHKVGEIRALLPKDIQCSCLTESWAAPNVVEDALSFAGNATKKAVELACWLAEYTSAERDESRPEFSGESFVLADDSGLEVDALGGAPGVTSARFAADDLGVAGNSPDVANNQKLLRLLEPIPREKRTARFRCVIALAPIPAASRENRSPVCYANEAEAGVELFEGTCEGRIGFEARGEGGFGYDPLFLPLGFDRTFAQLGESTKNQISHRAQALKKLREYILTRVRSTELG